jgi:large subunit ribosomal protein L9
MATHVQVVLKEDVANLGKTGELVRVKPGYARNYLLPRGLAAVATRGNIEAIEHEQKAAIAHAAKLRSAAEAEAAKLGSLSVTVTKQVGEGEKIYGSVTTKDIAEELKKQGVTVDKKKIVIPHPIKQLGDHEVQIKLAPQVAATVKVTVVKAAEEEQA